jgi:NTE family protein
MTKRALVLGGGGPVGIAWESGLLAGLAQEGVSLKTDLVFGTSAGSFVGAAIASGQSAEALAQAQIAQGMREKSGEGAGAMVFDTCAIDILIPRLPAEGEPSVALLLEFGALSKTGSVFPEPMYLQAIAAMGGPAIEGAWPQTFACGGINADSAQFKAFSHEDRVSLLKAIGASCAVPGIFPAVSINDALWFDGGFRSPNNVDQALGHDRVIALSVMTQASGAFARNTFKREVEKLRSAGAQVEAIVPDAASLALFGPNLMNATNRAEIAKAGIAQGRALARDLGAWWDS